MLECDFTVQKLGCTIPLGPFRGSIYATYFKYIRFGCNKSAHLHLPSDSCSEQISYASSRFCSVSVSLNCWDRTVLNVHNVLEI